ncbi:MAG: amidohydrolase family protein [Microbacteriaceae bacterium]
MIDAHLHLWQPTPGRYAWLERADPTLRRPFTAAQAHRELAEAGLDAAILVQAEDSQADTEAMLATAAANPWLVGVVGWVPLDDTNLARRILERWLRYPAFCGVRHLVHDDPRDDFLQLPAVRRSLMLLAEHGIAFDVPDAWPRHLSAVVDLAAALPGLTIVLDHLGKPPIGSTEFSAWQRTIMAVAAHPNTVAKVSGLHRAGQQYGVEELRPVWDLALELFGPTRLMYGGDWPMTVPGGGYARALAPIQRLSAELSGAERHALFHGTAVRSYSIPETSDV